MTQYYIQLCSTPLLSRRFFSPSNSSLIYTHEKCIFREMFMMSVARVAMICSTQAKQLASVHRHSMSHPTPQQGKANVAHKCHNKHLSYWMFSAVPQLGSGADGLPSCDLCSCLAALKDDHFLWSSRLFALSPHKVQEQQTYSRGQLKLHWLTDIIWTVSFSKTKQRQINYL